MRLMEIMSAIFALALILFTAHTYLGEKSVEAHLREGKPVICRGAVLREARLLEIGGETYVEEGDLMFHIDECEKLSEEEN
ncbi:MAG TPA: hypothetical protein ENJ61_02150 [Aquifex aeolicus]|uniref:Uncharacterized protein n=1 Tax=Aquifex aeolicus TaxID=63363 RepID=A0A7C5L4D8_AQUAO|nr:hypothetical protein [Aquifex aeolicus]